MAHTPLKISIEQVHKELNRAWSASYSAEANASAIEKIQHKTVGHKLIHLISRLFFRGIYFPQMTKREWLRVVADNRRMIFALTKEAFAARRGQAPRKSAPAEYQPDAS